MEPETAVDALAALGQRSRLEVFQLLVKAGPDGLSAGDIARAIGAPANTMSVHLSILNRAGLVAAERQGRSIMYRLDVDGVRELFAFLVADCCGGHPELCGPFFGSVCDPASKTPAQKKSSKKRV